MAQRRHGGGNDSTISPNGLWHGACLARGLGALDAWHPAQAALAAEILALAHQVVPYPFEPEGRDPQGAAPARRNCQLGPTGCMAGALSAGAASSAPLGRPVHQAPVQQGTCGRAQIVYPRVRLRLNFARSGGCLALAYFALDRGAAEQRHAFILLASTKTTSRVGGLIGLKTRDLDVRYDALGRASIGDSLSPLLD